MKRFLFTGMVFIISLVISNNALATDMDVYANILKKLDGIACTQPEKLPDFYGKDLVILVDDKRALLENRVKDYRQMMADFRGTLNVRYSVRFSLDMLVTRWGIYWLMKS